MPAKYVISVAVEAGIADRLSGLISEFYFALLSKRAFKMITYGDLPDFNLAYNQPFINWTGFKLDDRVIDPLKFTYKGARGYTGDRSYDNEVDTQKFWSVYHVNADEEVLSEFFYGHHFESMPLNHSNAENIIFASNRGRVFRLFDNPYHKNTLKSWGLRPNNAFRCAFNFLFTPNKDTLALADGYAHILKDETILKIGINIRTGDNSFADDTKVNISNYMAFFDCAKV